MFNPLEIPESRLYALPFEKDALILTLETLNSHSNYNYEQLPLAAYETRMISYRNEFLTLGITFHFEKEERVYLKVTERCLLVSCSVDTDSSYLSRYAYFALFRIMSMDQFKDYAEYFWPDFFDTETGESRFLDIINDSQDLNIYLKEEYSYFLRPNDYLYYPTAEPKIERRKIISEDNKVTGELNNNGVGFCVADSSLCSWHSNHFPFLITYHGLLTADKKKIKTFLGFVVTNGESQGYTSMQAELCKMANRMLQIAETAGNKGEGSQYRVELLENLNMERFRELFLIWQEAIMFLPHLPHTHHFVTSGFENIKLRPTKSKMATCRFSDIVPRICLLWIEHSDYYELSYRFNVGEELLIPSQKYTPFFIKAEADPRTFYLFDNITDCLATIFFGERRFRIFILKAHYQKYFESYLKILRTHFEFINV